MEDLKFILDILQVDVESLTETERNALMLYVVPKAQIIDGSMTIYDHVKIERLMTTIAHVMEMRIQKRTTNHIKDIKRMGWKDSFVAHIVKEFQDENDLEWWGHRWAKIWMSSLFEDFLFELVGKDTMVA